MMTLILALAACVVGLVVDLLLPLGVAGGMLQIPGLMIAYTSDKVRDWWIVLVAGLLFTGLGLVLSPASTTTDWAIPLNRVLAAGALCVIAFMGAERNKVYLALLEAKEETIEALKDARGRDERFQRLSDALDDAEDKLE